MGFGVSDGADEAMSAEGPAAVEEPPPGAASEPLRGDAEQLRRHERSRYRAAAAHARRVYPGPLGELVARELLAYAEFGYRFTADALIPRLATQVLATPSRPAVHPHPDAA